MIYDQEQIKAARIHIGASLRDHRIKEKLTIADVQKLSGLRFETIKAIESGESGYTMDSALQYAYCTGYFTYPNLKTT